MKNCYPLFSLHDYCTIPISFLFWFSFLAMTWLNPSTIVHAQCGTYSQVTAPTPDVCTSSYNLSAAVNQCRQVCIDMTPATGGTPIPTCGSGVLTDDIWLTFANPYTNIPGYDGSLVLAWKNYPGFPNNNPTLALHVDVQGTVFFGFIPVGLSINCNDGYLGESLTCTDSTDPDYGGQVVLPAGSVPTNAGIRDLILASDIGATNATVTGAQYWMQIETFNNIPGIICFEVSTYKPGFSCGDPNTITFPNTGTSQTQNATGCLCESAQNSGYYNFSNLPCGGTADTYPGTTAYYKVTLPYTCNQIESRLLTWGGTGNVNVSILSDVSCPDIVITDNLGNVTATGPGVLVESSTLLAQDCLNTSNNNSLSTPYSTCLPAGDYWVLVSGAISKSNYTLAITVNDNTPVTVKATAFLEGAYSGGSMTTNLSTNQQLPLVQPFSTAPWNYFGTETVQSYASLPANTVDWVLVEVRDAADKTFIIERKAAFLLSNGSVVDVNGITNGVNFNALIEGSNYYVSIKHRNHLGAITANLVQLPNAAPINFTNATTAQSATTQLANVAPGVYALRAGDMNADGIISYSDLNVYLSQLLGLNPYRNADCNLNGTVTLSDFNLMRPNIGTIGLSTLRP